jgi:hypothetical protein
LHQCQNKPGQFRARKAAPIGRLRLNQCRTVTKDSDGQTVSVTDAAGKTTSLPTIRSAR